MFTTTLLGEIDLLKYMLNVAPATNVKLHLYTNNQIPADTDTVGNYTESTAAGYSSISLPGSQWTVAIVSSTACATYATQTFTYTAAESLYGYYITDNASSVVIWAEKFTGAPYNIPGGGGTIDIDAKICQNDCS